MTAPAINPPAKPGPNLPRASAGPDEEIPRANAPAVTRNIAVFFTIGTLLLLNLYPTNDVHRGMFDPQT
jgi:hypothetical protein